VVDAPTPAVALELGRRASLTTSPRQPGQRGASSNGLGASEAKAAHGWVLYRIAQER